MKKILPIFIFVFFVTSIFYTFSFHKGNVLGTKKINPQTSKEPTPTGMPKDTLGIIQKGRVYWISYFSVKKENLDKLFLYPNFENKDNSLIFAKNNNCVKLINGGFYTGASKPLGLFISENEVIKEKAVNNLINGIFYVTPEKETGIVPDLPEKNIRLALQTGPVLLEKGLSKKLNMINDPYARRSAIAITDKGEVFFLMLYNSQSFYSGPRLSDLPEIILKFANNYGVKFVSAANLDGGSASSYFNDPVYLEEISYSGSFFCVVE